MKTSMFVLLACFVVGCGDKSNGASSAEPSGKSTAKADSKKDDGKKEAPQTRAAKPAFNKKQLEDGYDAGFGTALMKEPLEKKIAAVEAKLGQPVKSDASNKTWYGLDGETCTEMKLNLKDGTSSYSTTDKANCGL